MTSLDNPALTAQLTRLRAARARMGMGSAATQITIQRPKDIVQGPIQRLTTYPNAAARKRAQEKERERLEKEEQNRQQMIADRRAFLEARQSSHQELRAIVLATARHFEIPAQKLMSTRRVAKISLPRQVAMYLAKDMTSLSYPNIGRRFHRDHTTVLHGVRRIESLLLKGNPVVTLAVSAIKDTLYGAVEEYYWGA